MKKMSIIGLLVANFAVGSVFAAANDVFKKSSPDRVAKGKTIFMTNCASCHGDKGDANTPVAKAMKPAPRNLLADPFLNKEKDKIEGIYDVVTNGLVLEDGGKKKPTAMIAFKDTIKSEEDRWNLAHYVKSLRTTK